MRIIETTGYEPCIFREEGATYIEAFVTNARTGVLRPSERPTYGFATMADPPVGRAIQALGVVGLAVEDASEGLERALALRHQSRAPLEAADVRADEAALASGRIAPATFEKRLVKATATIEDPRPGFARASETSYREAHGALAAVGDALIEGPLADQVDELLDNPGAAGAEARWSATWDAVDALRAGGFASHVLMAGRIGQLFAFPHRARFWMLRATEERDRHAIETIASERRGRYIFLRSRVRRDRRHLAPNPTSLAVAAEHRREWQARLLSGDDIDKNLDTVLGAEREAAR